MNKKQLTEWLKLENNQSNQLIIQTPNEIFTDLESATFKSWKHKAFAYSYYYLVSYLYRGTIYNTTTEDYCQENIITSIVAKSDSFSYITKRNGVLDNIGYTKTTSNYPVSYYYKNKILQFELVKDLKHQVGNNISSVGNRFFAKEPVKALNRFNEDYSGTFYSFQNTHLVTIERFVDIISNPKLGYVGLYLYAYLVMMGDKFPDGYQVSNKGLSVFLGCSEATVTKYTMNLEACNFIESERKVCGFNLLEKIYKIID